MSVREETRKTWIHAKDDSACSRRIARAYKERSGTEEGRGRRNSNDKLGDGIVTGKLCDGTVTDLEQSSSRDPGRIEEAKIQEGSEQLNRYCGIWDSIRKDRNDLCSHAIR